MEILSSWKVHLYALFIVIVAESIGMQKFGLVVFLPLFYALALGGILSYPNFKLVTNKMMDIASKFMPIAMLYLVTKIGLGIGPNLHLLMNSGWALIVQEFGHFFGTLIFGLPVALFVKMGREAVGACYSIDREPNIAIIAEKYGIDSPEGRGVMGMYICGTLFGALWISVLSGIIAHTGWFHPESLAMGGGIGSASMMAASVGSIVAVYPDKSETIQAYAAAANLMTTVLGIYFALFISLPVMVKAYNTITGRTREEDMANDQGGVVEAGSFSLDNVVKAPTLGECGIIMIITCILGAITNIFGYKGTLATDIPASIVLSVIAYIGIVIGHLPGFKKLPVVFWVSILAVVLSIPQVPGANWIVEQTKHINFLATTTPILAYGGLSLGKDIPAFKRLSWRIVPVALAVASGSFLCATLLAEVVLHLEGVF